MEDAVPVEVVDPGRDLTCILQSVPVRDYVRVIFAAERFDQ